MWTSLFKESSWDKVFGGELQEMVGINLLRSMEMEASDSEGEGSSEEEEEGRKEEGKEEDVSFLPGSWCFDGMDTKQSVEGQEKESKRSRTNKQGRRNGVQ